MSHFSYYKSKNVEFVIIDKSVVCFDEHCHTSNFIITVILEGNAMLNKNGNVINLSANDRFEIAPYEAHALTSHCPITAVTMCIKKELVLSDKATEYRQQIVNLLVKFSRYYGNLNLFNLFYNAVLKLFEANYEFEDNNSLVTVSRNEIERNPEQENKIEYYAKKSFISKYHFIRKFKDAAGLTPHKFQIQSRIRKSQNLLFTGTSIADTAILTGFFDQSHFNKYFKKIVGITPTEYTSSVRNFLQDKK